MAKPVVASRVALPVKEIQENLLLMTAFPIPQETSASTVRVIPIASARGCRNVREIMMTLVSTGIFHGDK